MKKGVEVWSDYDNTGRWCLRIKKARGRFTLDEITEIATEYMQNYYALIIKEIDDDMYQLTFYSATEFLEMNNAADDGHKPV